MKHNHNQRKTRGLHYGYKPSLYTYQRLKVLFFTFFKNILCYYSFINSNCTYIIPFRPEMPVDLFIFQIHMLISAVSPFKVNGLIYAPSDSPTSLTPLFYSTYKSYQHFLHISPKKHHIHLTSNVYGALIFMY